MASATKQALLAALSAAQGECISGQQLAQQLGVSRTAVHKAAAALAAQGYALEAAPRRGYRLAGGDLDEHRARPGRTRARLVHPVRRRRR